MANYKVLNWHMNQPCWPASRLVSPTTAERMTVYHCHYCHMDFRGSFSAVVVHNRREHPGKVLAITMYPPGLGYEPKGGG